MKKIRTCKDLNNALKDGLRVKLGVRCGMCTYKVHIEDMKGGLWVEDTKLVRDLVVKCRERGLLKFGY